MPPHVCILQDEGTPRLPRFSGRPQERLFALHKQAKSDEEKLRVGLEEKRREAESRASDVQHKRVLVPIACDVALELVIEDIVPVVLGLRKMLIHEITLDPTQNVQ